MSVPNRVTTAGADCPDPGSMRAPDVSSEVPVGSCVSKADSERLSDRWEPARLRQGFGASAVASAEAEMRAERFIAATSVIAFELSRVSSNTLSRATDGQRVSN